MTPWKGGASAACLSEVEWAASADLNPRGFSPCLSQNGFLEEKVTADATRILPLLLY
jgi:hypothetical protein